MTAPGPRFELAPPAKLNLFLRVLAREDSGYHGIETLLCRLRLTDSLEAVRVAEPGHVGLEVEGPDLGPADDNLVVRAARLVLDATGRKFGVGFKLVKRIPVAAGLGGGSADAAAALELTNRLAGNAVPRAELFHFAARLGADVPFFLAGTSLALAWGHGERLLALPPLPTAPVLLVVPPIGVATAEAYRWIDEARSHAGPRGALALDLETLSGWGHVARMAGNDFESPVFGRMPAVRSAFEALARTKPLVCRMSGSGSALFAVYRNARDRDDAKLMMGRKYGTVVETETA